MAVTNPEGEPGQPDLDWQLYSERFARYAGQPWREIELELDRELLHLPNSKHQKGN